MKFSSTSYRYQIPPIRSYIFGFNGKEKVNEAYGEGNFYDYGFRLYDPRIGRFLSVDPLAPNYPHYTPYQFASNSPIYYVDVDGAEGVQHTVTMNLFGRNIVLSRVISVDVHMAVSTTNSMGYSPTEARKVQKIIQRKYDKLAKLESGLRFDIKFHEFNPDEMNPNTLAKDLFRNNRTVTDAKLPHGKAFETVTDLVMWKESLPEREEKGGTVDPTGSTTGNRTRIDPDRGSYEFGQAEVHEMTHFFLEGAGQTIQSPNSVDDHGLGGWMTPSVMENGEFTTPPAFQAKKAISTAIVKSVPTINTKVSNKNNAQQFLRR